MQNVQHRTRGTVFFRGLWPVLAEELKVETSGVSETSNHISHNSPV